MRFASTSSPAPAATSVFFSEYDALCKPAVAVAAYAPGEPFAVSVGAVATPVPSVSTVVLDANVAEGPEAGAANVTGKPGTAVPAPFFTSAFSAVANAVLINVPCGVPAVAVTE